jgi:hypothetical protein
MIISISFPIALLHKNLSYGACILYGIILADGSKQITSESKITNAEIAQLMETTVLKASNLLKELERKSIISIKTNGCNRIITPKFFAK